MNKAGFVIGIIVLCATAIGYIPCFGWSFWFTLPAAFIGLILSVIALTTSANNTYENKNPMIWGIILNSIALIFGFFRWVAGGFFI